MTWDQGAILAVLGGTLVVFAWDRWRYDVVAITSLMACVVLGLIGPDAAFAGFSNPAVITVAAVLVISRALARFGAIDAAPRSAQTPREPLSEPALPRTAPAGRACPGARDRAAHPLAR